MIKKLQENLDAKLNIIGILEWPPPTNPEEQAKLEKLKRQVNQIETVIEEAKDNPELAQYLYLANCQAL